MRWKVTAYVAAQVVLPGALLAVYLTADLDVPLALVVAGCVGPAVGGLAGLLSATNSRSGNGGSPD